MDEMDKPNMNKSKIDEMDESLKNEQELKNEPDKPKKEQITELHNKLKVTHHSSNQNKKVESNEPKNKPEKYKMEETAPNNKQYNETNKRPGNLHQEATKMILKAALVAWTITPEIEKLTSNFELKNEAELREEPTKLTDENCVKNEPKIFPSKVDTTESLDEPKITSYQ
eukprot:12257876-Ditylum_brightwellii.AAC.1